jgi:hypothetical protein
MMIAKMSWLIWSPISASSSTGGTSWTLAVFTASSITIGSVAVSSLGFSFWSSSIALIPNGVAALPSPKMLAVMFSAIIPSAGWSAGTSGRAGGAPAARTARARDQPRLLADLEQPQEQREHADEAEGDAGGGLGEVERRLRDGVHLHEADGLELVSGPGTAPPGAGLGGSPARTRSAPLEEVVAGVGDVADRRERLREGGVGGEAELEALGAADEGGGVGRVRHGVGPVEVAVRRRVDAEDDRLAAGRGRSPRGARPLREGAGRSGTCPARGRGRRR